MFVINFATLRKSLLFNESSCISLYRDDELIYLKTIKADKSIGPKGM